MWTEIKSLCSLIEWADIIGINPYLVAQIDEPATALGRVQAECAFPFYQRASNFADRLGREEVAQALVEAQNLIQKEGFTYPAPISLAQEITYPRPANQQFIQLWRSPSGRNKSIQLTTGNIISMGVWVEELLDADAAIVATDPFSDGFDTFCTVTVAVAAGTTADEITVYLSAADIPDGYSRTDCPIRPVRVTISGLVATITFRRIQVVLPSLYLKLAPDPLNASDSAIYADTVDVYRRTVDLAQSGSVLWNTEGGCPNPPCEVEIVSACFQATDKRLGYVSPLPAAFDEATEEFTNLYPNRTAAPDKVLAYYIAGVPLASDGKLNPTWRMMVAKLATALLPNTSSGCAHADLRLAYYRNIPSDPSGNPTVPLSVIEAVQGAFGVAGRGAIEAYSELQSQSLKINRSAHA